MRRLIPTYKSKLLTVINSNTILTVLNNNYKRWNRQNSRNGRRKYHRGHRVEGQWIFGGIEQESGLCFLVPVERRDKVTLLSLIKDWILPGTCIISDCWKAYDCLEEEGFRHLTVNHSIQFVNLDTGAHTNNVEGMWRHAKASLSQYCRKKKILLWLHGKIYVY
ncbi:uncharacterized protein LOC111027609 [Myzus persicae]|uniref:uncharacterized protein LOC111027609 n=1 Tax=Myzus persicae TaxID=13164 RepID=UPI000B9382B8|nr:uncharacterized protein LOC111027609 [Myzus persicae]